MARKYVGKSVAVAMPTDPMRLMRRGEVACLLNLSVIGSINSRSSGCYARCASGCQPEQRVCGGRSL
jgi:hypothetical protein